MDCPACNSAGECVCSEDCTCVKCAGKDMAAETTEAL
jgi:hypothetical protein